MRARSGQCADHVLLATQPRERAIFYGRTSGAACVELADGPALVAGVATTCAHDSRRLARDHRHLLVRRSERSDLPDRRLLAWYDPIGCDLRRAADHEHVVVADRRA